MAVADDGRRMVKPGITFRVFVSSTFRDFAVERNALQQHVWPRLRELCRRHGARFQAIDLRWGVSRCGRQLPLTAGHALLEQAREAKRR